VTDLKDDLAALRIEREPARGSAGKWIGWIGLIIVLAAGGVGGYRYLTRERPIEVQAATVTQRAAGTQAAVLNASGYVTARRRATVSSKITGKVVEVNVEEGLAVTEGQVLARLDDSSIKAALALSEAQLEAARRTVIENEVRRDQARVTLTRNQDLLKAGVATQADIDAAKADLDSYQARIGLAQQQVNVATRQVDVQKTELDNTIIRAPFSGIATTKDAQPGEMVSPVSAGGGFTRTGICTIVDMRSLEIDVDVNESYIGRVKPKQDVTAILDAYPDWQIPAQVITIVPTADRQKATVLVRISFQQLDPRLLPDMGVKVTFLADAGTAPAAVARPTALVPKAAIVTASGQTFVFVVHGDTVERRAVKTGGADGDRLEVVAGLENGDRVVLSPPAILADGMKIVVK
jgi:RND family efflux transporter MFP subunit